MGGLDRVPADVVYLHHFTHDFHHLFFVVTRYDCVVLVVRRVQDVELACRDHSVKELGRILPDHLHVSVGILGENDIGSVSVQSCGLAINAVVHALVRARVGFGAALIEAAPSIFVSRVLPPLDNLFCRQVTDLGFQKTQRATVFNLFLKVVFAHFLNHVVLAEEGFRIELIAWETVLAVIEENFIRCLNLGGVRPKLGPETAQRLGKSGVETFDLKVIVLVLKC